MLPHIKPSEEDKDDPKKKSGKDYPGSHSKYHSHNSTDIQEYLNLNIQFKIYNGYML